MRACLALAAIAIASCGAPGQTTTSRSQSLSSKTTVFALAEYPFESPWNHELSGIAWDANSSMLFAISDERPQISTLKPAPDFQDWTPGETLGLRIPNLQRWDGEGIALFEDGFLIANERPPALVALDRTGAFRRELPLPRHFAQCHSNRCLESLTLTADRRFMFTANEGPLDCDGPQPTIEQRGRIRILRTTLGSMKQEEFVYETERVSAPGELGELGIPDMVAISADVVLVLERSFIPPETLDIRIYRADLAGARDVLDEGSLANATPVPKTLLVDLGALEPGGPKPPASGYRVLSNYEGMARGPHLEGDRTALFLVSDDNARLTQTRRLLTLAVPDALLASNR